MQLFFSKNLTAESNSFEFDKEESRHIFKVLRKQEGDSIHITNGLGMLFFSEITLITDRKCVVKINKTEQFPVSEFGLHIAVAPTKMNDRFEWFLEKATEIGIREITPLLCDHSERKVINHERFEKIVVAAMKQSNQLFLPVLHPLKPFKSFVEEQQAGALYIAHCYEHDKKTLHTVLPPKTSATILIGPEGDFSEKEVKTALEKNYIPVSLGHTRLRTETAALVATHTFSLKNES